MSDTAASPPGWYEQGGQMRFWDGIAWTEKVRPLAPPAPGQAVAHPQPYAASGHGAPPGMQVAPKSPAVAVLASFFIPGLGSMLNGETGKGVIILVLYAISWGFSLILIGIPFLIATWIFGMVDANSGAKRWNLQHGIIS